MAGEVMRKKLLAGQLGGSEGGPGADRAWRLAFARATRDMMGLPLDFLSLTLSRVSLAEVLDLPPERALILMLEGPADGLGLMILSPDLVAALVEVLTMGKCGTQQPDIRKPTRTDAAMLSPLADLALSHLEEALAEDGDLIWTSGFRYASFIEEARPLGLLLEDVGYRALSARLSLAQGAREGDLWLIFPAEGRGRKPQIKANTIPDSVARPAFAAALALRVDGASSQIEAVMARLKMPISEVMELAVDMVLPLPSAALDRVNLEGLDGRRVADGKLGQHRGMRAIRLMSDAWGETGLGPATGASATGETWGQPAADMPQAFAFDRYPATGTD